MNIQLPPMDVPPMETPQDIQFIQGFTSILQKRFGSYPETNWVEARNKICFLDCRFNRSYSRSYSDSISSLRFTLGNEDRKFTFDMQVSLAGTEVTLGLCKADISLPHWKMNADIETHIAYYVLGKGRVEKVASHLKPIPFDSIYRHREMAVLGDQFHHTLGKVDQIIHELFQPNSIRFMLEMDKDEPWI